jgi:DNA-directed RNA polymerase subunit RPC12/RpoP
MNNDASKNTKMMPAICTQCGAQVEVDAQREKAICQYCGMQYIVEKAINTYNIQHATIEHVNSINIVKKGTVESVLNFVTDQQQRADDLKREKKEEERKEREELERRKQLTSMLHGESPSLRRGCLTGLVVMIVFTLLIGLPAQALDKSLFNVVSTTGSERTSGPLFSVAIYLILFLSMIGFAYGWAPKAKIWMLVTLWIASKINRNKKTSPSPEEAAASINLSKNKQNMG